MLREITYTLHEEEAYFFDYSPNEAAKMKAYKKYLWLFYALPSGILAGIAIMMLFAFAMEMVDFSQIKIVILMAFIFILCLKFWLRKQHTKMLHLQNSQVSKKATDIDYNIKWTEEYILLYAPMFEMKINWYFVDLIEESPLRLFILSKIGSGFKIPLKEISEEQKQDIMALWEAGKNET